MTALCANQLIERGLLDIEAPVATYWPEFAAAGKEQITVRWLLSHKAGLCGVRTPLPKGSLYENVAEPLGADFHIGIGAENDARTAEMYGVHIGNKPARVNGPAAATPGPFAEFARRMQEPGSAWDSCSAMTATGIPG